MNQSREENVKKLAELLKDIRIGMLTTVEQDGSLHTRPMATQQQEFDGTLWFFTQVDSAKVQEVERDHHVSVSYVNSKDDKYVSVSGMARVVRDSAKAKELWTPLHKAWFPEGLEDPKLALLRVDIERAEYWDTPSSAVVRLVSFAKSRANREALRRRRYRSREGSALGRPLPRDCGFKVFSTWLKLEVVLPTLGSLLLPFHRQDRGIGTCAPSLKLATLFEDFRSGAEPLQGGTDPDRLQRASPN